MSFKETVLPDFVIAELYPASLSGQPGGSAVFRPKAAGEEKNAGKKSATVESATNKSSAANHQTATIPQTSAGKTNDTAALPPGDGLPYKYLGKNYKKVSVIARYPEDPYITEEHLQFLIKILSACKLNLGDVAILNDATANVEVGKLKAQLAPAFVLLFDIEPVQIGLPLSFPLLRPQSFDGSSYLTIPAIASLLHDSEQAKGLKKQLWDSLKKMFGV